MSFQAVWIGNRVAAWETGSFFLSYIVQQTEYFFIQMVRGVFEDTLRKVILIHPVE